MVDAQQPCRHGPSDHVAELALHLSTNCCDVAVAGVGTLGTP